MLTAARLADAPPAPTTARPPRIALFSGNYNYVRDGANRALNRLVADLERRDVRVRVYSPTSPDPAFAPAGTLVSVPSVRFPGRADYRFGLGLPRSIRDDVIAFAPDIVHVSSPDWTGCAAQKLATEMGRPVVASLHTRFETYARFYGAGIVRPLLERHLAAFYGRSDRVLVPTRPILRELADTPFGDRVRLWSRGVDRHQFDPARRDAGWRRAQGIGADDCALLFFGRLVREKGLADYVRVVERLAAAGIRVRPLVVGDGPERGWLERRLPDARLTGHLAGEALGRAVASADIFFNPSTSEAFGNVTLEAMASGLPSVCVDVPSGRALLDDDTGLFYPSGDAGAAAAAVSRLASSTGLRRRMGRAARIASGGYGWPAASEMVWNAYRELLQPTGWARS